MANTTQKGVKKTPVKTVKTTVESTTEHVTEVETPVAEPKKWANDEGIRCRSVTSGPLYWTGIKSHISYIWSDEGDITEVEYQDLVAAVRSSSTYITKPYFVVEDEDFAEQYPIVKQVYEALYPISDLREVLDLSPADMKSTILSLPEGARETIKTLASQMIANGQLDSIKKISILDDIFGTKLLMMTELFQS